MELLVVLALDEFAEECYSDRFKSAFAIRGLGAGHERRHELHVQNEIAVPPVSTCSCFTNAESWHRGRRVPSAGIVRSNWLRVGGMRGRDAATTC